MSAHPNAIYYALRGGFYQSVVAVISETQKQCFGHEHWRDMWLHGVRMLKSTLSGRFDTFEQAEEACRQLNAIRDEYVGKRRVLDEAERSAIRAVVARREGER
jgi:hypothetical protein